MKIGEWNVRSVVAGKFRLDGGAMFGVVPKTIWSRAVEVDDQNRISMVMRILVIQGQGKTIVVDTGCGTGYDDKLVRIYALELDVPMRERLSTLGITPEEVSDVVVTHLHFDHAGGVATREGSEWRLTFPNAMHHIQRPQWEHALAPNPRDRASFFPDRIEIMEEMGKLRLHDGEWGIAPGIELHVCHGHTPGQQLPRISGDGRTLFFCGDLVPMAAHFPTPYVMSYDLQPVVSMGEKTAFLARAAKEGWILCFEHDPRVEACTVLAEGNRFSPGERLAL